jgi:hypothetical protein
MEASRSMTTSQTAAAIEARYWVPTPDLLQRATERLLQAYPHDILRYPLCRNDLGETIHFFHLGSGPRHVVLLGGVHGHEPMGPCGLAALMDGLLSHRVPGSDEPFAAAETILQAFSMDCVPLLNPDAARRWGAQVRDSYPALQWSDSAEDFEAFRRIHSEPGLTLHKGRVPHFTPEEVINWRKTGKPMGSLFTEEGVELWKDWAHGHAMQTVAMRELLRLRRPVLFVDIHGDVLADQLFIPYGLRSEADRRRHEELATAAYDALEANDIPCVRKVVPYIQEQPDLDNSTNWAYLHLGSMQFLFEVDMGWRPAIVKDWRQAQSPPLTKAQIVMSVWHGITALLLAYLAQERPVA